MNTSGDRLRALLRECHLSATDFAANRNVTPQHVNNWFKRGIPMARMGEVAELLTVNPRWLRSGEGPKHPGDNYDETSVADTDRATLQIAEDVRLPLLEEIEAPQGLGQTVVVQAPTRKIRLPLSTLQSMSIEPGNAVCAQMIGNSMAEKIQAGSIVGIDRGLTQIIDGEMYVLEHDGMLRVKYLYRLAGGCLRLRSHNSAEYPDEVYAPEQIQQQNIRVVGWVFWWSTLNTRRRPVSFR
ncbi:S24 family peptidase [Pseudomonas sp. 10B1]|uniref:LexA family transcriptional regulator n=1 Tax=unclassified Pseudomonas TaxID=196821 RepID=UPI002B232B05|nr:MULTISPECIES: S24 family peptidase [unclassified Pseudomonas]MEA9993563.1 S24 family peptidase [Pseudomonas sp. AA4]MEB0087062.1 S24 family peptidase [Pseudomonas sp. RTI1]MEB0126164.1 S24 family peptidase [Pseudomonas sp. CCC1.2]MEB0153345.1 S24 family peptidase [Pseudomonas sp. CCC4.3]MEB0218908.1 S24 family peptidase [Pseudomonas sp. AB12(2023)]